MATNLITRVEATETVAIVSSIIVPQTMVQSTTSTMNVPVNHADKPEKFNDLNFKRWQQKMLLLYNI